MAKTVSWAALFLCGAGVVSAQSLPEIAKKEKERRARTGPGEPVRVIGNGELAESTEGNLSVVGTRSNETEVDGELDFQSGFRDEAAVARELTEKEIEHYRETWTRIWPERLAAAEKRAEIARDHVYQCQSASHYVYVPLAIDCDGVYERLAIAEYRLRETRQNRYNWELLLPERTRPPPTN